MYIRLYSFYYNTETSTRSEGALTIASTPTENNVDKRHARSDTTRQNILDAAIRCYRELGVAQSTMEDVARVSGVARATLYRHFPNQGELLSQVITREMAELQTLLHHALPTDARCEDYLVECALIILRESPRRALTRILFEAQSAAAVSQMSIDDSTIAAMGADWLKPFYQRASAEGILRDWVSEAKLQEWITRILVSLISAPSKLIDEEVALREFLYDAVVPSIIQRQTADQ